ncbi:NTP transferase domain-containing protein [Nonomuraea lactucae]|uniref:NTP transferase domain-containing protein n=1 Tax=Nonomuraea lactucae TaxID=2249762 RepID=UPI000DE237CD|nr:NTP transferase domain-containing protein [Nonomuraea lactucae]
MNNRRLTVVVPCGGRGSRLGLPFAKELLPTPDGRVVLDAVLDLIHGLNVAVVLVVAADRAATIEHVHTTYPDLPVAAVRQRAHAPGLAGAVRSALPWTGRYTIVLLPDQFLLTPACDHPVEQAAKLLATEPACFLAAWEDDPVRIAADGALAVQAGEQTSPRIRRLADKPDRPEAGLFNAVWFGYGFRDTAADEVLAQLELATEHRLPDGRFAAGPLFDAPVVIVPGFLDLGTWPAVNRLWSRVDGTCA